MTKRVYISSDVTNTNDIIALQQMVNEKFPIIFTPIEALHVTLFHYGFPRELYAEILKVNPDLSFEEFFASFRIAVSPMILEKTKDITIFGREILLSSEHLDIFGEEKAPVVVLRLEKSRTIMAIWKSLLLQTEAFLVSCGILETTEFFTQSPNLRYSYGYNPHITLGAPHDISQKLPSFSLEKVRIDLSRPRLSTEV